MGVQIHPNQVLCSLRQLTAWHPNHVRTRSASKNMNESGFVRWLAPQSACWALVITRGDLVTVPDPASSAPALCFVVLSLTVLQSVPLSLCLCECGKFTFWPLQKVQRMWLWNDWKQQTLIISTAWRHASMVYAGVVCLSVCLSQVDVLLKRLNVGSHKQYHTIAQGL